MVDWLRRVPLHFLQTIDLSRNHLGSDAFFDLIAWLLSLSDKDILERKEILFINFRSNKVPITNPHLMSPLDHENLLTFVER
jgi:hypothetical protein